MNLNAFCCIQEPPMSYDAMNAMVNEDPDFSQIYNATKSFIAMRREQLLSKGLLHVKAFEMSNTVYDHFVKAERREQLAYEQSIKAVEEEQNPPLQADIDIQHRLMTLEHELSKSKQK